MPLPSDRPRSSFGPSSAERTPPLLLSVPSLSLLPMPLPPALSAPPQRAAGHLRAAESGRPHRRGQRCPARGRWRLGVAVDVSPPRARSRSGMRRCHRAGMERSATPLRSWPRSGTALGCRDIVGLAAEVHAIELAMWRAIVGGGCRGAGSRTGRPRSRRHSPAGREEPTTTPCYSSHLPRTRGHSGSWRQDVLCRAALVELAAAEMPCRGRLAVGDLVRNTVAQAPCR